MKLRLYVDEVGNPDLGSSEDKNHRYLSLTGVLMDLAYVEEVAFPQIEALKRKHFESHPDDPVILHRKELVSKKYPFERLKDSARASAFNSEILELLERLQYTVVTVAIDKMEHKNRYSVWRFDPYHYCLRVMLERFVAILEAKGCRGDVMAESRGGKEDRRLKESFEKLVLSGTDYVEPQRFLSALTSRQLKVKPKANNISGLQIADLLAHPSFRSMLAEKEGEAMTAPFGIQIVRILNRSKYHRSKAGKVDGYGRKWLP
ncbi:MAG: DUF3800 domain-containing protein [Opitutales bacterium]|nr:DUF3800 domain-containing protein [Opitutales bacterium]